MKRINGRVLFSLTGGGLYKEAGVLSPEISPRKVAFPFLVTSFSRMNKDTYDEKKYPYYTQSNSDNIREFFKEITCKAYGKDGLSQIAYNLSDKFSTRFINNYHRLNPITDDKGCQGENGDDNFEKMVAVPIYEKEMKI